MQPPIDLDTTGIDAALGRKGTADGGIDKFTIARQESIAADGHVLPPTFGVTTINFQPVGGGKAAINGDFVMTAPEVQKVIQALRKGGIDVVALHNHALGDEPRLFYAHYWAVEDGVTLGQGAAPCPGRHEPHPRELTEPPCVGSVGRGELQQRGVTVRARGTG